ncbi:unnamed protein product [Lathyrus oleraceus]
MVFEVRGWIFLFSFGCDQTVIGLLQVREVVLVMVQLQSEVGSWLLGEILLYTARRLQPRFGMDDYLLWLNSNAMKVS